MTEQKIPLVSWGWSEGRVWDNWMLVHFLSGTVVAGVLMLAGTTASYAYLIGLIVLTLWEFAEMAVGVKEEIENLLLDIVVGMLGFFMFSEYLMPALNYNYIGLTTFILFVLASVGSFLGWRSFAKRKANG